MPRKNSSTRAVNDTVTAARLEDINQDIDDLYSEWPDRLRVRKAISWTPLRIDITAGAYYIWSTSGVYAWWTDIVVTDAVTNYVMINNAWTITISTSARTAWLWRLAQVVCSGGAVTSIILRNNMVFWWTALDVTALTEDTNPDEENDFLIMYDTSAWTNKKVKPNNISPNVTWQTTLTTPSVLDEAIVYDTSATGNKKVVLWILEARMTFAKEMYDFFTDFINAPAITDGGDDYISVISWTGAVAECWFGGDAANIVWYVNLRTWSTATWRVAIVTDPDIIRFWWWPRIFEAKVRVPNLQISAQRYQILVWFFDTYTAANQVDGAYFLYDLYAVSTWSAASANRQICTVNNSTRTFTTTWTAVPTNTRQTLRIEVNAAWTSITFYINWSSVWTHTTNIPTGAWRDCWHWLFMIKSTWTSEYTFHADYVGVNCLFTSSR